MMSRRTSGSPPVMRSLRTPLRDEGAAEPVELLERQQVLLRQERHVLRHAVDAAEVAAVRHRDAQIGDRPPERIDQRLGRSTGTAVDGDASDMFDLGFGAVQLAMDDPAIRHDDLATLFGIWLSGALCGSPMSDSMTDATSGRPRCACPRTSATLTSPSRTGRASTLPAEYLRVKSPSAEVQGHVAGRAQDRAGQARRRDHRGRAGRATTRCGSSSTTCTRPASSAGTICASSAQQEAETLAGLSRRARGKGLSAGAGAASGSGSRATEKAG